MLQVLLAVVRAHPRQLTAVTFFVVFGYFFLLPMFWPAPRVSVAVPATARLDADLPVRVQISAWHANYQLSMVRLFVDNATATAVPPGRPLYPIYLRQQRPRLAWNYWRVNRWTWPRRRRVDFVVPLKDLAAAGQLQPGVLTGKVDVEVRHIQPIDAPGGGHEESYRPDLDWQSTPVAIAIQPGP